VDYLLDKNHVRKIMEGNKPLSLKILALSSRFAISMSILGELFFAVYASKRSEKNFRLLKLFLDGVGLNEQTVPNELFYFKSWGEPLNIAHFSLI